jgi:putative oxidoreductase
MVRAPNLKKLDKFEDIFLLGFRLLVGGFLIYGTWDNISSAARMAEFAAFLKSNGFIFPDIMAPLSVWAQFLCGVAFCAGFLVRWAGLVCAFNFLVAIVMVDSAGGIRASFPSAMLIAFGLYIAARGAGSFALQRN